MDDANYKRAKQRFTAKRAESVVQLAAEIGGLLKLTGARVEAANCKGKNKGTMDYCLKFAGGSLFLINLGTKENKDKVTSAVIKALTAMKQSYQRLFDRSGEILAALKKREQKDNKRAVSKGLKPYTLKRVGISNTGGLYCGWVYVVLDIGGKERLHIETELNQSIMNCAAADIAKIRRTYFPAGEYKDGDVDFIEGGAGFIFGDAGYTVAREGVTLISLQERADVAAAV